MQLLMHIKQRNYYLITIQIKGELKMTLKKMKKTQDVLQAMVIHENGIVSHRGFISYIDVVDYRERNKNDKVVLEEGTRN